MQLSFDFGDSGNAPWRPLLSERLFFGVFPDLETARGVRRLAERCVYENHLRGWLLDTPRLHMSVHHVGDRRRLDHRLVYGAQLAGKAVLMPPFEVTLNAMETFKGAPPVKGKPVRWPTVLLSEGDGPLVLFEMLRSAMGRYGLRAASWFKPHMTLFYGPDFVLPQKVEPIRFVVREFVLIHSECGLSRYNALGRWPLGA